MTNASSEELLEIISKLLGMLYVASFGEKVPRHEATNVALRCREILGEEAYHKAIDAFKFEPPRPVFPLPTLEQKAFKAACEEWLAARAPDYLIFGQLVAEASKLDITVREMLARTFQVNPSTVRRWVKGPSRPHPLIARQVIIILSEYVTK